MSDQTNTTDTAAILQQVTGVEASLRTEIDKISLATLIGKWVSEHVALVGASSFVAIVSFIGSIVVGSFWVKDNIVFASDFNKGMAQIQKDVASAARQSEIRSLTVQRLLLSQRLDNLSDKDRITAKDQAKIDKLKTEIDHINRQIEDLERLENESKKPTE